MSYTKYFNQSSVKNINTTYGLIQLKYVDSYISKRKIIAETYRNLLSEIDGIEFLEDLENVKHAYSYFPILVNKEKYGKNA